MSETKKTLSETALEARFLAAQETARVAGKYLISKLETGFAVTKKGRINLVTEIDVQSERLIVERLLRQFPNDDVLAEEESTSDGDSGQKWIIDPIDGTTNFAHGYPFFCVSIAFEVDGVVELGVVYDPNTGEMFAARKGAGAQLNGRTLRVSEEKELVNSLLSTGFPYELRAIESALRQFEAFIRQARAVRRDGSAALDLCYVAAGRFDGFWELDLNAWDVAAGQLIVAEAGGRVSRFDRSECSIYDREILASNGGIHEEMVRVLES